MILYFLFFFNVTPWPNKSAFLLFKMNQMRQTFSANIQAHRLDSHGCRGSKRIHNVSKLFGDFGLFQYLKHLTRKTELKLKVATLILVCVLSIFALCFFVNRRGTGLQNQVWGDAEKQLQNASETLWVMFLSLGKSSSSMMAGACDYT